MPAYVTSVVCEIERKSR